VPKKKYVIHFLGGNHRRYAFLNAPIEESSPIYDYHNLDSTMPS